MTTYSHTPSVELLRSRFQHPRRHLFFTRARLLLDRIELSGWKFGTRYRREILLATLCRVEWQEDGRAAFYLKDTDEPLMLVLRQPTRWQHTLEAHLRWRAPDRPPRSADHADVPLNEVLLHATRMG